MSDKSSRRANCSTCLWNAKVFECVKWKKLQSGRCEIFSYELNSMIVRIDGKSRTLQTKSQQLFKVCSEHIILKILEHWTGGVSVDRKRISNQRAMCGLHHLDRFIWGWNSRNRQPDEDIQQYTTTSYKCIKDGSHCGRLTKCLPVFEDLSECKKKVSFTIEVTIKVTAGSLIKTCDELLLNKAVISIQQNITCNQISWKIRKRQGSDSEGRRKKAPWLMFRSRRDLNWKSWSWS